MYLFKHSKDRGTLITEHCFWQKLFRDSFKKLILTKDFGCVFSGVLGNKE